MPLSLRFPVTCNPCRAVTLPNVGVPECIGVLHRVRYPHSPKLPYFVAVANVEEVRDRTTQTLFEVILLPQRSPRSYIDVIANPLILRTTGDVHTSPPTCPLQGRRGQFSPNFSGARETCMRLPQLFKTDVKTSLPTFPTQGRRAHVSSNIPPPILHEPH